MELTKVRKNCLLLISIKYHLKTSHQEELSFSIFFLVLEIFIFSNIQIKAGFQCHLLCLTHLLNEESWYEFLSRLVAKLHFYIRAEFSNFRLLV